MKNFALFTAFLILNSVSFSQASNRYTFNKIIKMQIGKFQNFQLIGQSSDQMIDSLFSNFPNTKHDGYIWKFKKVMIPGFDKPVTLQVHQGIQHIREDSSSYFNTFSNADYKSKRLSEISDNENVGILIYIKRGRKFVLTNDIDAEKVKNYLTLIQQ